ncbi:MAG: acyl-CoA thioesterase [Acidimicrobiales bacterium]
MADDSDRVVRLLDLESIGDDAFLAPIPSDGPGRLFGGQVASQSLRAACLTVAPDRPPHSLHAYFILPGRPGEPLRLDVQRSRDGRSFATRHVTASQAGTPIFELVASFHTAEGGFDWQLPAPADVPAPDAIAPPELPDYLRFSVPFDIRVVTPPLPGQFPITHPFWIRTRGPIGDDPSLHACVLTLLSDMGVVASARAPGSTTQPFAGASLDHAVWFHRPARVDEWLLFSVEPVTNHGARGLARGTLHTEAGVLVASIAQEALLRPAGEQRMA